MNSTRHQWYVYYWKGFLLMSVAGFLICFGLFLSFSAPIALTKKAITTILTLYGFFLIMKGGKIEKMFRKELKNK
jgi:uncharacterized membrane protein